MLFEFIHQLCDELGAPEPNKVFVVPGRERGRHAADVAHQPVRRAEEGPAHRPGAGELHQPQRVQGGAGATSSATSASPRWPSSYTYVAKPHHRRPRGGRGLVRPVVNWCKRQENVLSMVRVMRSAAACGSGRQDAVSGSQGDHPAAARRSAASGVPRRPRRGQRRRQRRVVALPAPHRVRHQCFMQASTTSPPRSTTSSTRTTSTCTRTAPRPSCGGRRRSRNSACRRCSKTPDGGQGHRGVRRGGGGDRGRGRHSADVADAPVELRPRGERQGAVRRRAVIDHRSPVDPLRRTRPTSRSG